MKLTATKTMVVVDFAVSCGAMAPTASAGDHSLACAVGAVSVGRSRGNF